MGGPLLLYAAIMLCVLRPSQPRELLKPFPAAVPNLTNICLQKQGCRDFTTVCFASLLLLLCDSAS